MSGHSHAKKIRHQKEITDQKRGQVFSKLLREISVAAREGGDPNTNTKLRLAMEKAKQWNLPKENIERAIKRGSDEPAGEKLKEIICEAYGPGGTAIIIEGITDNKNRTLSEIKQILTKHGGKLASEGSVKWLFERKGCVIVDLKLQIEDLQSREKLEMLAIEAGAEDIYWHNDLLDIYTKPDALERVKQNLEAKQIKVESASLDWVAKEEVSLDEKTQEVCQKLFDDLDENEAAQDIYSNLKT